jgi:predicted DNA-binding transcriptional regulator YafY
VIGDDDEVPQHPSGRLLRLLSLLQMRPGWTGPELADRLGVTTRTVRRDVDRLRELGYFVDSAPGTEGGYRLEGGASMPPLLLDDDEVTAVTIALRGAAAGPVSGLEDASLSALSKLDRVLPTRLRPRVESLRDAMVYLGTSEQGVDPDVLVVAAHASATGEQLRLTYEDRLDRRTERRIEPHKLVCTGRRWYLVARDVEQVHDEAGGWRTFRVDRVVALVGTGHRFRLEDPPDAAELVARAVKSAPYDLTAEVRFALPAAELEARLSPWAGQIRPDGDDASILATGASRIEHLAAFLLSTGLDFEILEPAELRTEMGRIARRVAARHRGVAADAAS